MQIQFSFYQFTREGPKYLEYGKLVVYDERQDCGKSNQKLDPEVVHLVADGSPVSDVHL